MQIELNELELAACISGILQLLNLPVLLDMEERQRLHALQIKLARALNTELSNERV